MLSNLVFRWLAATLLVVYTLPAFAQSSFGVVLGTVEDATGAVVSGAIVKLTNLGENLSRETVTDASGAYQFQNVKPGDYSVTVTQAGFRTFTLPKTTLLARQNLRVNAKLALGEVNETVEVSASVGVIATETGAIASRITSESVLSLPVNVRASTSTSPYALLATLPGVQPDNGNGFSIQGGVPAQSETTVDGISTTRVTGNSPNRDMFPSVESIAEIQVRGVGNSAEYGTPGDITTISKSGTNDFHGALFWYHQNRALDARSFGQTTLPSKVSNLFGGTIGGPVRIPGLYNGKDKTFFLFSWESHRFPRQSLVQNTVPTDRLRNGDFTGETVTVRDPLTGTPFAGNVIPSARINGVARAIIPFYPQVNFGSADRVSAANFRENRDAKIESDAFDVRVDHSFGSSQQVFGRFTQKLNPTLGPNNLSFGSDTRYNDNRQVVASHNWTLKANLLNEARFGWTYGATGNTFPFDGRAFVKSLGLRDIPTDIFFNGLPNFQIDTFTGFSKGREGFDRSTSYQFIDNLTWIRGRHTMKFGGDFRKLRAESSLGFTTGNSYGDYLFSGNFSGSPWGDFLLGTPVATQIAVLTADNDGRASHYKLYAQDSFRVSQKLTLDYGVRWEFHPGYKDAGLNIANFDRSVPRTGRVIVMSDPKALDLVGPGPRAAFNACPGPTINGVGCTPIVRADEVGLPDGLRKNYYTQFLPRLGFAYRANEKTTIRGSYGLYNMITLGSVFFSLTGTVQSDVRRFENVGADGRPIFTLPNTRTSSSGVVAGSVGTFEFRTANQIDFRPPQMMQWSVSLDREVVGNLGVRLSYIGSRSYHMPWAPDINQMLPDTRFFSQRPNTDRPFPNWGLIFSRDAGANTFYNAFQAEASRRLAQGLSFNATYTLARNQGDNAGPAPTSFAGETGGGRVTNSYDRRGDYGNIYATRRHRFVNTLFYELPFGKGRKYMNTANAFTDAVLGGWQLGSVLTLQSGPWLTPTFTGGDPSGTNAASRGAQRPDQVGDPALANPSATLWLDRNAFVCPGRQPGASNQFNCAVGVVPGRDIAPIGRFGNAGVGILEGPGTVAWNLSLSKRFYLRERLNLQLEGSFTNLPNTVNLADPVLNIADNNFGRITSARGVDFGGGRTGQVGLRLQF